jgi:hypothetical protein
MAPLIEDAEELSRTPEQETYPGTACRLFVTQKTRGRCSQDFCQSLEQLTLVTDGVGGSARCIR